MEKRKGCPLEDVNTATTYPKERLSYKDNLVPGALCSHEMFNLLSTFENRFCIELLNIWARVCNETKQHQFTLMLNQDVDVKRNYYSSYQGLARLDNYQVFTQMDVSVTH